MMNNGGDAVKGYGLRGGEGVGRNNPMQRTMHHLFNE